MNYPQYGFNKEDADNHLARFVRLDNPASYPFDEYHAHEYNELLVFMKGGGIHNVDFREYKITDNSLHLLSGGTLHWMERGMKSSGFAIVYKEQFLYKLQAFNAHFDLAAFFKDSRILRLNAQQQAEFENLFAEILDHKLEKDYLLNLIGTLLTKIAIMFAGAAPAIAPKPLPDDTIIQLIDLVQKHFLQQLKAKEYAEMLHISLSALEKKVKKATGKSIQSLQQERLLKEAKRQLCQPEKSIKEIASGLGFLETAHFSNWFKKNTNVAPSAYKNEDRMEE